MQPTTKEKIPDEFKVGDIVWCAAYGKGKVTNIDYSSYRPIRALFEAGLIYYTRDGRLRENTPRILFFSEPKIEGAVKRPFVPTIAH